MALVLRDFYVLDGFRDRAQRADLLIQRGEIAEIAPPCSLEVPIQGERVDGKGQKLLLPGFVNAHCHAAMTLLRGLGEERPLMEWLEGTIWPLEAKLTASQVYDGTAVAALEMIAGGVSCFADMYYHMASVAAVVNRLGCRGAIAIGVVSRDPELLRSSLYRDYSDTQGPLIVNNLDPHAPYTVGLEAMKEIAASAKERGLPLQFHFLEAAWERDYIERTFGLSPLQYLEETGLLELDHLVLAHGVHLLPQEFQALARPNVTVVHCPSSNLKLGDGVADLPAMLESGMSVALGTDGAASNNRLDLWAEMRLAALLHKGIRQDSTAVKAQEALRCATYQGAQALGFQKVGKIQPGWAADLSVVDLRGPHYLGVDEDNMAGYLVYAGSSADVESLLCQGRWIYRDRQLLRAPASEIMDRAAASRRELLSRS